MGNDLFLRITLGDIRKLGLECAGLYAYLLFVSRRKRFDNEGFFHISYRDIIDNVGLERRKVLRYRKKLECLGLIKFVGGKNGKSPRYKIMRDL